MTNTKSKVIKQAYRDYLRSNDTTLWHIYGRFSEYKQRAYDYCVELMRSLDGYDLRIIGHNCDTFSVGFRTDTHFVYITKSYDRQCELQFLED